MSKAIKGRVILIVGPDGCGKSTIARGLAALSSRNEHVHHRPRLRPTATVPVTSPHSQSPRSVVGSLGKLAWVWAGYQLVRPRWWWLRRQGRSVVVERGWHDLLVDPRRYRLHARAVPVARLLGHLVPRADVTILLAGAPEVIAARKSELDADETARQIEEWRDLAPTIGRRFEVIDTSILSEDEARAAARRHAASPQQLIEWRSVPFAPSRLRLTATSSARPDDFCIFRGYRRSATVRRAVAVRLHQRGIGAPAAEPLDGRLRELLAATGSPTDRVVVMASSARDRLVCTATSADGSRVVVTKVGNADDRGLACEAEMLDLLRSAKGFQVPRIVWAGEHGGHRLLVTSRIPPSSTGKQLELDELRDLCRVLQSGQAIPVVHGDLAPWNVILQLDGSLALVDWEAGRKGRAPLWDFAHHVVQQSALLHAMGPADAVGVLTARHGPGWRLLEDVGEEPWRAPSLLRDYLIKSSPSQSAAGQRFRSLMLHLLP